MRKKYSDYLIDFIRYDIFDKGVAKIIGYDSVSLEKYYQEYKVPERIEVEGYTYEVIEICKEAFSNCTFIDKLVISSTIRAIDDSAFYSASFSFVEFKNGNWKNEISLGKGLFYDCHRLRKVILPDNLQKLPETTFLRCFSLDEVVLPKNLAIIEEYCFKDCISLKHFDFTSSINEIHEGAFYSTGLNYAEIGYQCKYVGSIAFGLCGDLETLVITNPNCKFEERFATYTDNVTVFFNGTMEEYKHLLLQGIFESTHNAKVGKLDLLQKGGVKYLVEDQERAIVVGFVDHMLNVDTIVREQMINLDVKEIVNSAFRGSKKMELCVLPKSLEVIGENVFSECSGLMKVVFQSNITLPEAEVKAGNNSVEIEIV